MDELNSEDVSFIDYGFGGSYSLGGNLIRPRKDDYLFSLLMVELLKTYCGHGDVTFEKAETEIYLAFPRRYHLFKYTVVPPPLNCYPILAER